MVDVLVQDAGPATDVRGGQQVLHAVGAGEAAYRLPGQAELADDSLDSLALGAQGLDLLVALAGAFGQPALLGLVGGGLGDDLVEVGCWGLRRLGGWRRVGWLGQASVMTSH